MSTGLAALRGTALAAAAFIGFSIAGTTRNTAAALGTRFAYFVGAEMALRNFWEKEIVITLGQSAVNLGVGVSALLLICAVIFRRRDVT